jgi:hypothetical protein
VLFKISGVAASAAPAQPDTPASCARRSPAAFRARSTCICWLVPWQHELVDEDPRPLLRGLIHSDGCRVLNRAVGTDYPPYPRYEFTNASADIRDIFTRACDAIGVEWRRSRPRVISVARRASVAILDSFVGPKN